MSAVPELRFPEFAGQWRKSTLSAESVSLDSKRIPLKEGDRDKREGVYPYYGASGIIDHIDDYIFDEKVILLAEDGANILSRSSPIAFLVSGKSWVNNHAHVYRATGSSEFLVACLENIRYEKYNTGTVQPKLNAEICAKIPLRVPTLPEQQKIATFLGAVDNKIDALRRKHDALKQFKAGLMQKLFSQELRFKRDDGSDYPDWEEKRLGELLKERKTSAPKSSGLPHISLTTEGVVPKSARYDRDFLVRDDSEKKYKITRYGDLCYNPANLKFGVISMNKLGDGLFSPIYVTFEIGEVAPLYLEALVKQADFQKRVRRYEQGTVYERMAVSPADFLKAKLDFPCIREQQKIADALSAMDAKVEAVAGQITHMENFKAGLLQKMFV